MSELHEVQILVQIINVNPSCDVTIFVKRAQNAEFSFRIFSQDFRDFERLYLWNESRY